MNRFGAFGIHLGISFIVFLVLGYVILFHWYPDFFFASDGGWQGIRIVAFVDLVLGPVLTLVVFNRSKPRQELRRDLSIIGTFQFCCLLAGTYVVYSERPIAMVYADGFFHSMTADDYLEAGQPVPDLAQMPGSSPRWVSVRLPDDPTEQSKVRRSAMQAKRPISALSEYYEPFEPSHIDAARDGLDTKEIVLRDERTPFLAAFLKKHGGTLNDYIFLPFGTRYELALIAFRTRDNSLSFLEIPGDSQRSP